MICSYVFYPLAYLMGFPTEDLFKIGELMGVKVFAHSLVGYARFSGLVKNRYALEDYIQTYNGTWYYNNTDLILEQTNRTLVGGILSVRKLKNIVY